ncbi:hypothetical protein [Nonomuraea sp. SYSU D8015]|uniref:hypothetical protein n=1 Tax=Nonomuraea sp. SYSU D8015 TaxID=2593644 RepID=UPI001CB70C77|nr:hypothetical protein [Nonomuraea sp. SYSU D8015]
MSHRKLPLADGQSARTATARALLRGGMDEKTGEALSARAVAERVGWGADLAAAGSAGTCPPRRGYRSMTGSCGWFRSRPGGCCGLRSGGWN